MPQELEVGLIDFHFEATDLDLLDLSEFAKGLHLAFNLAVPVRDVQGHRTRTQLRFARTKALSHPHLNLKVLQIENGSVRGRLGAILVASAAAMTSPTAKVIAAGTAAGVLTEIITALPDKILTRDGKQISTEKKQPETTRKPQPVAKPTPSPRCLEAASEIVNMAHDLTDRGKSWSLTLTEQGTPDGRPACSVTLSHKGKR